MLNTNIEDYRAGLVKALQIVEAEHYAIIKNKDAGYLSKMLLLEKIIKNIRAEIMKNA